MIPSKWMSLPKWIKIMIIFCVLLLLPFIFLYLITKAILNCIKDIAEGMLILPQYCYWLIKYQNIKELYKHENNNDEDEEAK